MYMTTQNQIQDLDAFLASCETTDPKLAALLPSKLPLEPYQSSLIRVLINSGNFKLVKQHLLRYFYFVEYSGWHHYDARAKAFRHLRTLDEIVCSGDRGKHTYDDVEGRKQTISFSAPKFLKEEVQSIHYHYVAEVGTQQQVNFANRAINVVPPLLHRATPTKELLDANPELQQHLDTILHHLKAVWCAGNEECYSYMLSWLAGTACGVKHKAAIYLESLEQVGKGILIDFLMRSVLGRGLCFETSSTEVIDQWTSPLEGKLLVSFNELACSTTGAFLKIKNKLKPLIADPTFTSRAMHENPKLNFPNTFNILICSNNNAMLADSDFRRKVFQLDVDASKQGDAQFFNSLSKAMDTKGVGELFYCMLVERWAAQGATFDSRHFPVTQMLKRKLREGTDNLQDFIRDKFVLRGRDLSMPFKQFYVKYTDYCRTLADQGTWKSKPFPKSQLSERLQKREKFEPLSSVKRYESAEVKFALIKMRLDKGKDTKTLLIKARHSDLLERWKAQHYLHDTDEVDASIQSPDTDTDSDDDGATDNANPLDAGLAAVMPVLAPEPIKKPTQSKPKSKSKPDKTTTAKSSLSAAINTTVNFDL